MRLAFHPAWGKNKRVRGSWWFGLLGLLALSLSGCLETEAKLTWHEDGSMDLTVRLEGDALAGQTDAIASQLRASGFRDIRVGAERLTAVQPLKLAGWDRWSGWLPGRLAYQDPSGLVFSRTSWVVFEDYALDGELDAARVTELPSFVQALNLPFVFKVEAPWPALASNATRVEGERTYVWQATLGRPFPVHVVYRRWYPERIAVLVLLAGVMGTVLWRRSRRRRRA